MAFFVVTNLMDEAYKILPKSEHEHWDRYKNFHSEKVVNYTRSILLEKVNEEDFIRVYSRLTSARSKKLTKPASQKRKEHLAKRLYEFLIIKAKWIK